MSWREWNTLLAWGHGKTRCKDLESSLIEKEHSLGYQKI